jgi:hypothetical protein
MMANRKLAAHDEAPARETSDRERRGEGLTVFSLVMTVFVLVFVNGRQLVEDRFQNLQGLLTVGVADVALGALAFLAAFLRSRRQLSIWPMIVLCGVSCGAAWVPAGYCLVVDILDDPGCRNRWPGSAKLWNRSYLWYNPLKTHPGLFNLDGEHVKVCVGALGLII